MPAHRRTLKRVETPGHARYLTWSCYRRLPLFRNDRIKALFLAQLDTARRRLGFALYAWVIMPDPPRVTVTRVLHAVKRPVAAQVLRRWRELNAPIRPRITDARGHEHFWQRGGGYDRNIFNPGELHEKISCIHDNPRRRGLVTHAIDWP